MKDFDMDNFKKNWLETAGFDMVLAERYLMKNKAVSEYIALTKKKADVNFYKEVLLSDTYFAVKQYMFYRMESVPFDKKKELIEIGMKQNLYVRQAIAETVSEIPVEFKAQFETFLDDASYKTKEIALVNLCKNFPEDKDLYLKKIYNLVSNKDKNLHITWLGLAVVSEKNEWIQGNMYHELVYYTRDEFESSTRQKALEVLLEIYPTHINTIVPLFRGTTHHKWQFTKFCRETIREKLKNPEFRSRVEELAKTADEKMAALYNEIFERVNIILSF